MFAPEKQVGRTALAMIGGVFVSLIASSAPLQAQGVQSPWGLRNVNFKNWGLNEWPACATPTEPFSFQQVFGSHSPGHINFWLQWGNVEPAPVCPLSQPSCTPVYDWSLLHTGLDKVLSVGAAPVLSFKLSGTPLMQGTAAGYAGPIDLLDPLETPQFPTPLKTGGTYGDYYGYSERLYLMAKGLAEQIKSRYDGSSALPPCAPGIVSRDVYVTFHPESWDEWGLGDPGEWNKNLNTYILSYLTVRQAFEDVEAGTNDVSFHLSHGSIPRWRVLADRWFQIGKNDPTKRAAMITRFQSFTERIPNVLKSLQLASGAAAIGPTIDNWDEVTCYASSAETNPCATSRDRIRRNDAWMDAFVDWTCDEYFDFNSYHGHAKPRWDDQERVFFDEMVEDEIAARIAAGQSTILAPQEWMITEAAFEVLDPDLDWPAFAGPEQKAAFLANRDQFVIEDYARKWCTLLAQDDVAYGTGGTIPVGTFLFGFCSPVVAGNNNGLNGGFPRYTGLNEFCECSGPEADCGPAAQPPCSSSLVLQRMDPNPANQAFVSMNNEIGVPDTSKTVHDNWRVQLRFDSSISAGRVVDVVWKKEWLDITENPRDVTIQAPGTYRTAEVLTLDAQGNLTGSDAIAILADQLILPGLTQTPQVVVWTP